VHYIICLGQRSHGFLCLSGTLGGGLEGET